MVVAMYRLYYLNQRYVIRVYHCGPLERRFSLVFWQIAEVLQIGALLN